MTDPNPSDPKPEVPAGTPAAAVPAPQAALAPAPAKASPGPTINIGREFGTAKRNLPPAKIVLLAIGAVVVVAAIAAFVKRAQPQASGSLDSVMAAEIPGGASTMVALTFTLKNSSDQILYVHDIHGKLQSAGAESSSEAVSAVDFDRYFLGFPALKHGSQPALVPEAKLQPGEEVQRTVIVAFPVSLQVFNQRQTVSVVIQPYDQPVAVTLTR